MPLDEVLTMGRLDHRPMFWTSRAAAHRWHAEGLAPATVTVRNLDEVETAVGVRHPPPRLSCSAAMSTEAEVRAADG